MIARIGNIGVVTLALMLAACGSDAGLASTTSTTSATSTPDDIEIAASVASTMARSASTEPTWLFALTSVVAACSDSESSSSATSAVATPETVPSTSTVPATTGVTTTDAPVTTTATAPTTTLAPPIIYRWSTPGPMAVDLQFSGASPPSLIVAGDDGRYVEIRLAGIPEGVGGSGLPWDGSATSARTAGPLEVDGAPFVIESLHSGFMATVAVTTDGQLVAISSYEPTFTAISHPGRVTDVAMRLGPRSGSIAPSGGERLLLGLWAAGYDQIDGQDVPVVWQTSGLDALDGEISGVQSSTVVVTGSAGATGPVLVGVDDANMAPASGTARVFALLSETDGSSRLWVVQDADRGMPGRTELRFRDPTAIEVSGDGVWIGDADGLHYVDLAEPKLRSTTLWETPVRVIHLTPGDGLLALDADGRVIRPTGEPPEVVWEDPAATDFTVAFGQLVILHRAENEIVVLDPTVLV